MAHLAPSHAGMLVARCLVKHLTHTDVELQTIDYLRKYLIHGEY